MRVKFDELEGASALSSSKISSSAKVVFQSAEEVFQSAEEVFQSAEGVFQSAEKEVFQPAEEEVFQLTTGSVEGSSLATEWNFGCCGSVVNPVTRKPLSGYPTAFKVLMAPKMAPEPRRVQ